ncbi:MAG: amidoligase family protein [Flavobacterium sp.]
MSFDALTFGVEIECFIPKWMDTYSLKTRLDTLCGVNVWKVVSDGSLKANRRGKGAGWTPVEVVTHTYLLGSQAEREINKLCAALKEVGAYVNETCGLHVHVGARAMTTAQIGKLCALYALYEPQIDSFMMPERRASRNHYCKSLFGRTEWVGSNYVRVDQEQVIEAVRNARTVEAVAVAINGHFDLTGDRRRPVGRYHKVNLQCFTRLGTIEFRHHHATVDAKRMWMWVKFLGRLTVHAMETADRPLRMGEMSDEQRWDRLMTRVNAPDCRRHFGTIRGSFAAARARMARAVAV